MATLQYKDGNEWKQYIATVVNGGTGADNYIDANNNLHSFTLFQTKNITGGEDNDTNTFWRDHEPGLYYFDQTGMLKDQPGQYGWLFNIKIGATGSLLNQIFFQYNGRNNNHGSNCVRVYHRSSNINSGNNVFTSWQNEALVAYPVGAIYISSNSTSPASLFGGTWTELKGANYLRANSTFATGGSNSWTGSHTHTGPSHTHSMTSGYANFEMNGQSVYYKYKDNSSWSANWGGLLYTASSSKSYSAGTGMAISGNTGSGGTGNTGSTSVSVTIEPQFQDVYVWRRTG